MRSRWFGLISAVALLVFGLLALPHLPAQLPAHWNAGGQASGTQSRLALVLLGPAIVLGLWLLALVLPRIDPRGQAYGSFLPTYWLILNAVAGFTALTFVLVIAYGLGWAVSPIRVIPAGLGLLFMVLGNELGRVQPNWFVGIRTPWTLSDPAIWRATHRLGARTFVAGGFVIAVFGLLAPLAAVSYGLLAVILAAVLVPVIYSYLLWRHGPTGAGPAVR